MTDQDPLIIANPSLSQYSKNNNRRGRPCLYQVKNFSPQPKSLIILNYLKEKGLSFEGEDSSKLSNVTHDTIDLHSFNSSDDEKTTPDEHAITHCKNIKGQSDNQNIPKDEDILDNLFFNLSNRKNSKDLPKKTKNNFHLCDYNGCGYSTKFLTNLTKHRRIHTKEKPYLCDQCIFRSNYVSSLKVHKRIHTSERPYCCEHCGYQCNSISNLKKHMLHKHG